MGEGAGREGPTSLSAAAVPPGAAWPGVLPSMKPPRALRAPRGSPSSRHTHARLRRARCCRGAACACSASRPPCTPAPGAACRAGESSRSPSPSPASGPSALAAAASSTTTCCARLGSAARALRKQRAPYSSVGAGPGSSDPEVKASMSALPASPCMGQALPEAAPPRPVGSRMRRVPTAEATAPKPACSSAATSAAASAPALRQCSATQHSPRRIHTRGQA
mmetsp:Transcript_8395/g.23086  ORF Transcript_8395/g.23086 Transcript_8395/m.23086 type:complete len:222 (-) Transcript_8395:1315-1980(-)